MGEKVAAVAAEGAISALTTMLEASAIAAKFQRRMIFVQSPDPMSKAFQKYCPAVNLDLSLGC